MTALVIHHVLGRLSDGLTGGQDWVSFALTEMGGQVSWYRADSRLATLLPRMYGRWFEVEYMITRSSRVVTSMAPA